MSKLRVLDEDLMFVLDMFSPRGKNLKFVITRMKILCDIVYSIDATKSLLVWYQEDNLAGKNMNKIVSLVERYQKYVLSILKLLKKKLVVDKKGEYDKLSFNLKNKFNSLDLTYKKILNKYENIDFKKTNPDSMLVLSKTVIVIYAITRRLQTINSKISHN